MNVLSSVFQYLFNKFTLKFIALLMAIFLWSFVKSKNQIEITRKINVLISEPSGFVTPAGTSYQKEVHLSGPKTLINQVNAKTLVARVHPSPDKAQIFETTLNQGHISGLHPNITVKFNDPSLSFFIDRKVRKKMKVHATYTGFLNSNLTVEKVEIKPASVMVSGPEQQLSKYSKVYTKPIALNLLSETSFLKTSIQAPANGTLLSPQQVEISIKIQKKEPKQETPQDPSFR